MVSKQYRTVFFLCQRITSFIYKKLSYNDRVKEKTDTNITKRMLVLAVEIGLIFAIPAIIVGISGPLLDQRQGTENMWTIILFVLGLLLSWGLVIRKYKTVSAEIKKKKQNGLTEN